MKKFLSILFICILSICGITFSGCGGGSETVSGTNDLYLKIITEYGNGNGYIDASIDLQKVLNGNEQTKDKSDIFNLIYTPYLNASSGLLFGVAARQGKTLNFAIEKFNGDQISEIYNKLQSIYGALLQYDKNRGIYEQSAGNLMFDELMASVEVLIDRCYSLNDSFARFYFSKYAVDFSKPNSLNNGTLRDFLVYEVSKMSKLSYYYEFLNNKYVVQDGTPTSWYNDTIYVRDFLRVSNQILAKTYTSNDLYVDLGVYQDSVRATIENLQSEESNYDIGYQLFNKAKNQLNLKSYFDTKNKTVYVSGLDDFSKSRFEIINNFIKDIYNAHMHALENIMDKLKGY